MASSDSIIRNVFRQVTGQEASDAAINAARDIPDQQLASFFSGSGGSAGFAAGAGGGGGPTTADSLINSVLESIKKASQPLLDATKRSQEFDEKNPFVFDEILARQSAEERLSPYYQAELKDYVTGIERSRGRTVQDEEQLRAELDTKTDQVQGNLRRDLEETIRGTQEAADDSGLLFSGRRLRQEGKAAVETEEDLATSLKGTDVQKAESLKRQGRNLEDLLSQEQTFKRRQQAEQETSLQTDVEEQKREQQQQRELERQQFVGYPLTTGTQSLTSILGL